MISLIASSGSLSRADHILIFAIVRYIKKPAIAALGIVKLGVFYNMLNVVFDVPVKNTNVPMLACLLIKIIKM